ncbi:hypothetical protein GZH47_02120 [Paenibacillus rhizovicinus]|uniref:Uncharacterized protein n=1 Tax=Paenibacillus rhizovicinus TaxID=2704463 RepID=A0A6C0NUG1_9BACL|nr:hypothetical protein [Paenibacillus rhizovicinus]QHW29751.1 hypothetical protein GZH47_02120 [Paenibacillus rhizovicinus]
MSQDDTALQINEIFEILKARNIFPDVVAFYQKNDRITDYLLDNKYMLVHGRRGILSTSSF